MSIKTFNGVAPQDVKQVKSIAPVDGKALDGVPFAAIEFMVIAFIGATTGGAAGSGPNDPTTDTWLPFSSFNPESQKYVKGEGWQYWKNAVLAKIALHGLGSASDIEEGTDTVDSVSYDWIRFHDYAQVFFYGLFKTFVMGHGCPPSYIKLIKQYSTVGTKVGHWMSTNWWATGPYYSGWTEPYRQALLAAGCFEQGTFGKTYPGTHCDGDLTVDPGEPNNWRLVSGTGTGAQGAAVFDGVNAVTGTTRSGTTYTSTQDCNYTTVSVADGVTIDFRAHEFYHSGAFTYSGDQNPPVVLRGKTRCIANQAARPADGEAHLWYADWRDPGGVTSDALVDEIVNQFDTYWDASGGFGEPVDFFHSDNFPNFRDSTPHPYGAATNAPSTTYAEWVVGYDNVLSKLVAAFGSAPQAYYSGNTGDFIVGQTHPGLKRQFWEHTFTKGDNSATPHTAAAIRAGLEAAESNGAIEVYCGNHSPEDNSLPDRLPVEYLGPGLGNLPVLQDWTAEGHTPKALWYMFSGGLQNTRCYLAFRPEVCRPLR